MPDCIFCAIAAGSIPVTLVAETANTVAFPDMSPKADLHVLVIPRAALRQRRRIGRR